MRNAIERKSVKKANNIVRKTKTKLKKEKTLNMNVRVVVNTHTEIKRSISNQRNTKHLSTNKHNNNIFILSLFKQNKSKINQAY